MSDNTQQTVSTCPMCGGLVTISHDPDGTSCYLPVPPDLQARLATLRELRRRAAEIYGGVLIGGLEMALREFMAETLEAIGAAQRDGGQV